MSLFVEPSAEALVAALWRTSWQVALLVGLVLVLQALFGKHLSPRWRYGMWVVVVARAALFPLAPLEVGAHATPLAWTVESVAGAGALPTRGSGVELGSMSPAEPALGAVMPHSPRADRATQPGTPGAPSLGTSTRPVNATELAVDTTSAAASQTHRPSGTTGRLFLPTGEAPAAQLAPLPAETAPSDRTSWPGRLLLAWALGSGLLLALLVRAELRFQRLRRDLPELDDQRLTVALTRAARVAGLGAPPRLVAADFVHGPAVTGLRRPVLLVPPGFGADLDARALDQVLLHEVFHLRRRDVHANAALAVVRALFWFHPLVHLALARLMGARESLRDWEALAASSTTRPRAYAETLLQLAGGSQPAATSTQPPLAAPLFLPLLRRRHDLERRILMIARFDDRSHRSWTLGLLSCLAVGWLGFTSPSSAQPGPLQGPEGPSSPGSQPSTPGARPSTPGAPSSGTLLRVERTSPEAAWHRDLRVALDAPLRGRVPGDTLADQIENLAALVGANLIWVRDADEQFDGRFEQRISATPAQCLDLLLEQVDPDIHWGLAYRSIVIGYDHELPRTMDLRIYDVSPLLEREYDVDDLISYLMDFCRDGYEAWEREHTMFDSAGPLLMVRNDYRVHAEVEALLNRILNLDEANELDAARSVISALDGIVVDVKFEEAGLEDALKWLAQVSGVPIGYDDSTIDFSTKLTMQLSQVSVLDVLSLIAIEADGRLWEDGPQVWLSGELMGRPVMRIYPLGALADLYQHDVEPGELLMNMVHDAVYMAGEEDDRRTVVTRINDLIIVQASPSLHAQVASMIATMEQLLL